jgi:uridine kinase
VYIIGIAGGSGSGKTTFAKKVQNHIGPTKSTIVSMDSYYLDHLPEDLNTKTGKFNFDHPKAFDWHLLNRHIADLKQGRDIEMPLYDFKTNARLKDTQNISPSTIILFEGIFTLFDKSIRNLLDIKCFLHVESDIRFTRRLHRDVKERGRSLESVIEQYYQTVRPMYQKYLDPQKQYADFTVGEETDVAATILAARIKELLNE